MLKPSEFMKSNPVLRIIAGVIGGVVGYLVVSHWFNPPAHFDRVLVQTASEMNKTLPMMVDSETRLDTIMPGPGNRLTYLYTLVKQDKGALDSSVFQNKLRPQIVANYKTSGQMKSFRDANVEMHYQYKDKNGNFICEIIVSPKDF